MNRTFNFSAGPSTLPLSVLEEVGRNISNYKGSGMSVMEMSHRSPSYMQIQEEMIALLKELMAIPDNYQVLLLQGGASSQFASIPLNLLDESRKADYIISGNFSTKAYEEALKYGDIQVIASSKSDNFTRLPEIDLSLIRPDASYVHMCSNNTIYGTRFRPDSIPQTGSIPLVVDMSSNILSESYDITQFGLLYAGAQKNLGPAGLTIVIIRNDLLKEANPLTPTMLSYKTQSDKDSMYNTPPTFSIYVAGLVLQWLKDLGGISAIESINRDKAQKLYNIIDQSDFYRTDVYKEDRSLMNIVFRSPSVELDQKFTKEADENGLVNLKGHRLVGGMRASIYNAMPIEGIDKLIEFMQKFETNNK